MSRETKLYHYPTEDPKTSSANIRALHLDDEEQQQEFLKVFLENDLHIKVTSTRNAEDTLLLVQTGAYDCLISDYDMPEMDGITLAKKIRETSNIPIIIYTGRGSEEVAERAFAAGIDDYIRKEMEPAHYQVLSKRIRQAVERRRSNESYRDVFDNATDAIFITSLDGAFLDVNKAAYTRLGYTREEIMRMSMRQIVSPLYGSNYEDKVAYIQKRGHAVFESMNITKCGKLIPVEVSSKTIKYMGNDAILAFSRDISDRKLLQSEMYHKIEVLYQHITKLATMNTLEEILGYSYELLSNLGYEGDISIGIVKEGKLKFLYSKDLHIYNLNVCGKGIMAKTARTGLTYVINDTRLDPDYISDGPEEHLSELVVPVTVAGKVIAVINLENEREKAFSDHDRQIVEILAKHISSVLSIEKINAIDILAA